MKEHGEKPAADGEAMTSVPSGSDVAIIGINGRFPGAAGIEQLWRNLCAGIDAAIPLTDEEMRAAGVPADVVADPRYVRLAQVVEGPDLFDATHFDYGAREAELIDPQQRLFLECAWELLERAGYDPEQFAGRIGVVASVSRNAYYEAMLPAVHDPIASFEAQISNDKDFVATRVAYKLNLSGPSLTVQTACSSSLVAVHVACQLLLNGEADMVIAGGSSVRLPQKTGYLYKEGFILSPDGRCRAFDAAAEGCNVGNGTALVLLRRLEDAVAEDDEVQAVIRGSAINNDGSNKAGFTAPSVDGQAEVIAEALTVAAAPPESIGYIEAHGTGTRLGDPIEVAALTKVFRTYTDRQRFCALGSVKTNLGHLDAAAGATGLIKAALTVKHGLIPPNPYFSAPNPETRLETSPFFVNRELLPWRTGGGPRRAGISSFGIGGTNAHAVLEQPPQRPRSEPSRRPLSLLLLSAKTASALDAKAADLAGYLTAKPEPGPTALADVAYTLQTGRRRFRHRRALLCRDPADAGSALTGGAPERVASVVEEASGVPTVFMFPGGGTQYPGMARELYEIEGRFREEIDRCAELLRAESGLDLLALLGPPRERAEEAAREMQRTSLALPALFAVEYALARLLMSWGVTPWAMIGHSLGEYTAACLAGVFSLADALRIVTLRGRLFEKLPAGAMLSVPLLETDLEPLLGSELSVAAVNGPGMCVASGPVAAIDALAGRLAERGLEARRLHIDVAAHSKLVAPILDEFGRLLATFLLSPPRTPFLSNVTGTWARAEEVTDPAYWVRHLRRTVRFGDGLAELMKTPRQVLLEVGPGRVLSNFAQAAPGRSPATVAMTSLRHPRDRQTDLETLLSTLGKLWLWGVDLDWRAFHAGERRLRVPLPTYPFERQSYLIEPRRTSGAARPHAATGRSDTADWFYVPAWRLMPPEAPAEEEQPRRHLLFLDAAGLGASLAERLEEHGHEVFTVRTGAAFARLHKRGFTLRPGEREDCERLLAALAESGDLPERIVHLWAVTADGGSEASAVAATSAAAVAAEQELGFHALAALAQALGEQPDTVGKVALTVVASGLHDISGGESSQPAKAPLLALCQAIQQEMPNVRCRSVDVVAPRPGSPATRRLTTQLLAEAAAEDAEPVIAYRGDRRWRRGFEPLSLHASRRAPLRQEGTYVIFGGTGRLGLAFAGRLAAAGRPSLALVSRRSLTPEAAERIGELRAHGAQVEVLNADLADREDLGRAMAAVLARFGRIDGVVHAAGVTGRQAFQTLRDLTRETCAELWRPKVQGLLALEEALSGLDLDFCVLTSCLSSILGGIGGVADAAANLFLEAFVQDHNRRSGQRWTALTWDRWETPGRGDATAVGRQRAILPEEGGIVFERALAAGPAGHLVISVSALESRLEQWREVQSGATAAAKGPDLHVRPGLSSSYVEPRDSVETALAGIFEDLLRIRPVGIYDNFFEMGGSSLIAAQILSRLRETFPVVLPPSVLFEAPTVAGLGELMRAADRDAVAAVETTEMVEMESGEI